MNVPILNKSAAHKAHLSWKTAGNVLWVASETPEHCSEEKAKAKGLLQGL